MTTYTNPHTAEVEFDTRLLELLRDEHAAIVKAAGMADRVLSMAKDYRKDVVAVTRGNHYRNESHTLKTTGEWVGYEKASELLGELADPAKAAEVAAYYDEHEPSYRWWWSPPEPVVERAARLVADYNEAVEAMGGASEAVEEHEEGYGGWARYWLVVSSAGHVHTTRECSTCNKGKSATRFALLPSLSGGTVDEVVALVGPNLCSTCYPLAPVADTGGKLTEAIAKVLIEEGEEAFRAKLAEHAAKAKAKCPADPYDHDGSNSHLYRPWAKCNVCGAGVSLTSTGKMRAHRPKGAR